MSAEEGAAASLPGIAVLAGVAGVATLLAGTLPVVSPLILAVGIGAAAANLLGIPEVLQPGIDRHKLFLETGIVLLGASVSLDRIAASGPAVLVLVLGAVGLGVATVELASRRVFALPARTGSLLAAGASICGVSAVVAVARGIDADEETLAYVAGTILLFDAVTLVAFPAAGTLLGLPDQVFGVWAGLSMFSTGPVAAAGFAYSPVAGRWATLTKLARNSLIGVLAVGYALAYADDAGGRSRVDPGRLWTQFPKFLVGFLAVVAVANAGVLSPGGVATIDAVSGWLFALAFAGVGFSIRIDEMRAAGMAPIAVLLSALMIVSAAALAAATAAL